jgi:hypothetical protein
MDRVELRTPTGVGTASRSIQARCGTGLSNLSQRIDKGDGKTWVVCRWVKGKGMKKVDVEEVEEQGNTATTWVFEVNTPHE